MHLSKLYYRKLQGLIIIGMLLASVFITLLNIRPVLGADWWNPDWPIRKSITIGHTKVAAILTDFPVLIDITDADLAAHAQSDGDDIVFTDSSGVQLNHEIELYDSGTGHLVAWANVPSLSSITDTILYMYYGNAGASNQEDPSGVWDSNYRMVQHFEETSGTHHDSTSNNNDGTAYNGVVQDAAGNIDGADDFDGTDDYVDCGSSNMPTTAGTIEAWIRPSGGWGPMPEPTDDEEIVEIGVDGTDRAILYLNDNGVIRILLVSSGTVKLADSTSTSWSEQWYHIVGTWDGTSTLLYVDGSQDGSDAGWSISTPTTVAIGRTSLQGMPPPPPEPTNYFNGTIDEVRISNIARSADWVSTEYNNQHGPNTFYTVEGEESIGAPIVSDPSPSHGATGVSVSLSELSFRIEDDENSMDYYVTTFPDIGSGSASGVPNGTYTIAVSGLNYSTTYTWHLNVTDGTYWTNNTYSFRTETNWRAWSHRQSHVIYGSPAGAQTNYPVKVKCLYSGNVLDHVSEIGGYEGTNPVIPCGSSLEWDEHIREIGNVLYEADDTGKEYKTFYSGYQGTYTEGNVYVGYAYSSDGKVWTKYGKVITRPTEDPYVLKVGNTYYLYAEDKEGGTHRNIRRYHSSDCQTWIDDGDVLEPQGSGWESSAVASPTVWYEDSTWKMLYEGLGGPGGGQTGSASSSNGLNWVRSPYNPVLTGSGHSGDWDETQVVPNDIAKVGSTYYLTYHGYTPSHPQGFQAGTATSTNLTSWTRNPNNPIYEHPVVHLYYDTEWVLHYYANDSSGIYRGYLDKHQSVVLDNKCRTDFGDVRFTKLDGTTELDYWMDPTQGAEGDWRYFWVELDYIPASPDSTGFYIYYGNPSSSTTSNGENTFTFFDDFETDLSKWSTLETGGTISLVTDPAIEGSQCVELHDTSTTDTVRLWNNLSPADYRVFYYHRTDDITAMKAMLFENENDKSLHMEDSREGKIRYYDTAWHDIMNSVANAWLGIEYVLDWTAMKFDLWINGSLMVSSGNLRSQTKDFTRMYYLTDGETADFKFFIDLVRVSKHCSPEPIHGSWTPLETTIRIDPITTEAVLNSDYTIYLNVTNVADLYAWEFQLDYNQAILDLTSALIVPGGLNEPTYTYYNLTDETNGHLWWAVSTTYPNTTGISYSAHAIFEIHFHTVATGTSNLDLYGTFLSDPNTNPIPHIVVNGSITVSLPPLDLTVTSVNILNHGCSLYKNDTYVNGTAYYYPVEVTVHNTGTMAADQFYVRLEVYWINGSLVEGLTEMLVASLAVDASEVVNFTSLFHPMHTGHYRLTATVDSQNNVTENNETNNVLVQSDISVTVMGDINCDGKVNILDAVTIAQAWDATPTDLQWNICADINHDGHIDILDGVRIGLHWGETW